MFESHWLADYAQHGASRQRSRVDLANSPRQRKLVHTRGWAATGVKPGKGMRSAKCVEKSARPAQAPDQSTFSRPRMLAFSQHLRAPSKTTHSLKNLLVI